MKLDFKPTRWNCRQYQVQGVGDGFYHFLIAGIPYHKNVGRVSGSQWDGLYRSEEAAMDAAQRYEDELFRRKEAQ